MSFTLLRWRPTYYKFSTAKIFRFWLATIFSKLTTFYIHFLCFQYQSYVTYLHIYRYIPLCSRNLPYVHWSTTMHVHTFNTIFLRANTTFLSKPYLNNLLCSIYTLTVHQANVTPSACSYKFSIQNSYIPVCNSSLKIPTGTPMLIFFFFPLHHAPTHIQYQNSTYIQETYNAVYRTSKYRIPKNVRYFFH